jgi:hypothetical protein
LSPEVAGADRCTLVFDTDSKRLYVELEVVAHLDSTGSVDDQTATMDIAAYLGQGGQTAGHRELWRLLRALFSENSEGAEYTYETSSAVSTYDKFLIRENCYGNGPAAGRSVPAHFYEGLGKAR